MNAELQQELEDLPPDEPRSPLQPHSGLILRWRRQGRSYRWICRMMREKLGIAIGYGPLYRFVKRRSKPRKLKQESEELTIAPTQPRSQEAPMPRNSTATADPYAEARERMRLFKEAPVAAKPHKVFDVPEEDLDGTKPLRMMKPNQPKEK
jgi:hypothetical protein